MDKLKSAARAIVESALRESSDRFDPATMAEWEDSSLGSLLTYDQLTQFVALLVERLRVRIPGMTESKLFANQPLATVGGLKFHVLIEVISLRLMLSSPTFNEPTADIEIIHIDPSSPASEAPLPRKRDRPRRLNRVRLTPEQQAAYERAFELEQSAAAEPSFHGAAPEASPSVDEPEAIALPSPLDEPLILEDPFVIEGRPAEEAETAGEPQFAGEAEAASQQEAQNEALIVDTAARFEPASPSAAGAEPPPAPGAAPPSSAPQASAPPPPPRPVKSKPGLHLRDTLFGAPLAQPPAAPGNASLVRIYYATDRLQKPALLGDPQFTGMRSLAGTLHYGACNVSIPATHKLGKLETPSLLHLEFRPDPRKHIVLAKTLSLDEDAFFTQVAASVAASPGKEAFVFVHGYNVSFEDAARRTGQMAFDLHFIGAPVLYSWPSGGKLDAYLKDETNITWSTPHLEQFLALLTQRIGAGRVHIIAHSMGNRAVCDALRSLSLNPAHTLKLTHLVLAAPDIDAGTFQQLAATLQRLSARITLYESSHDKAILASRKIHGNPRAGEPLLVIPGLDTIDASAIDTDFLGHSYFSDNWPLLSDIHSLLANNEPPSHRFGLEERQHPVGPYYAFRA